MTPMCELWGVYGDRGEWWVQTPEFDTPEGTEDACGPYDTKAEAEKAATMCKRAWKNTEKL